MKKLIAALVLPVFLVGCADGSISEDQKNQPAERLDQLQKYEVGDSDGDTTVYRINNGGTDCIIADSYESIAISCDWGNAPVETVVPDGFE